MTPKQEQVVEVEMIEEETYELDTDLVKQEIEAIASQQASFTDETVAKHAEMQAKLQELLNA